MEPYPLAEEFKKLILVFKPKLAINTPSVFSNTALLLVVPIKLVDVPPPTVEGIFHVCANEILVHNKSTIVEKIMI
jgi:hypothetical protein